MVHIYQSPKDASGVSWFDRPSHGILCPGASRFTAAPAARGSTALPRWSTERRSGRGFPCPSLRVPWERVTMTWPGGWEVPCMDDAGDDIFWEVGIFIGHLWMGCFLSLVFCFLHLKVGFDFFPQGAMVKQGFMYRMVLILIKEKYDESSWICWKNASKKFQKHILPNGGLFNGVICPWCSNP